MTRFAAVVLAASTLLSVASVADAATCTVSGNVKIQSLDSYYCDSNRLSTCGDWLLRDLDSTTKAMPYMSVLILSSFGVFRASATTSATGAYSASWSQPSCSGQVLFMPTFAAVHKADLSSSDPRFRFMVVDGQNRGYSYLWPVTLAGASTTFSLTFPRTTGVPANSTKVANVYFTTQSAVYEVVKWRPSLDTAFASRLNPLLITYDLTNSGGSPTNPGWTIWLPAPAYNRGVSVRHELGHKVVGVLHGTDAQHAMDQDGLCFTGKFGATADNHGERTCEWGHVAMIEALATFFAVRSNTYSDKGAWWCDQNDNARQDHCSTMATSLTTADRIEAPFPGSTGWPTGTFVGVGDGFATTRAHCARLSTNGLVSGCRPCTFSSCGTCPDANGDFVCDDYETQGFRNETNVLRFLWDMIDTNNEGDELTDESIGSFAALMEGMTCTRNSGYNVDGTCNEPLRSFDGTMLCNPSSETGGAVTPMRGTRDSYNPWDFGDMVPGSQATARSINCVHAAND